MQTLALATLEQIRPIPASAVCPRRCADLLSFLAGLAGMFALEGALVRAGAGRAVLGVFGAAAPILVVGLVNLARSAASRDWLAVAAPVITDDELDTVLQQLLDSARPR